MAARRPIDERVAEIDKKIEGFKASIATLEEKKADLLAPKARKKRATPKTVIDLAKKAGMSPEDMLKKLGLKIEE